ncbi:phthiocerol/phthiodiolone dimycocerosyl transferase family protein [Sciscionella marina]|uniref:phthiocerol/phthiodiolone dimycocerosyl transferase family protein n=1 Tax=Sciscionella marina TaxID=508770 RepID=UPI0003710F4D|nr:hypothetical protein [Sciscionella marina]
MGLRRYLDPTEVQHLGAAPAHVAEYRGAVDHRFLRQAFELLCLRHSVLRGRVETGRHGSLLYVEPGHRPEDIRARGDYEVLLRHAFGPWNPAHAMARLIHVRENGGGFVALRIDHAIVDGCSLRAIFDELWEIYATTLRGIGTSIRPGASLPRSPEDLLAERWRNLPDRSPLAQQQDWHRVPPHQGYIRFDERDTGALIAAARDHGTTVHALIAGAVLGTQCDHGSRVAAPVPMICLSPVNLRSRVTPKATATETTALVEIHKAELAVRPDQDPYATGRELKEQLDSAITGRELLSAAELPMALSPFPDSQLDSRFAIAQISNNGHVHARLERFTEPRFLGFFSAVDLIFDAFPIYSVFTFRGELSIRYLFPSNRFSTEDVAQLTESLSDLLRTSCGAATRSRG